MSNLLFLILGLIVLIAGGEFLVRGAVGIANKYRISPLVIGMTVVSFGTSAPELLVSVNAALGGYPDIAMANVIGSNISNLGLVLGLTVIIFPISITRDTLIKDWPMMMLGSVLLYVFILDRNLGFFEGLSLFLILCIFTIWLIVKSRMKNKEEIDAYEDVGIFSSLGFLSIGILGLYFGSEWLLDGAVGMAQSFGVEEWVIGVTIIAFGTSVPELVTSCLAAFRKEAGISIGNLIGSNVFNIMAVLGITSMVKDLKIQERILSFDIFWMLGISLLIFLLMLGRKLNRVKGLLLLSSYLIYMAFVIFSKN